MSATTMFSKNARVACASRSARASRKAVVCQARKVDTAHAAAAFAAASALLMTGPANALTYDEIQSLTYKQVKGTGVANTCAVLQSGTSNLSELTPGAYKLERFCMEPTSFTVREESQFRGGESEFVNTRLLTRLTYTLDAMSGTLNVKSDGTAELKEEDGIDYAATTVQLPGGERVPLLFSIKKFDGVGPLDEIRGDFTVPSYRGATFMDPKGRGAATGWDNAVALPARADSEEFLKENQKINKPRKGSAVLSVARVDTVTGEIAGVFESIQPSDDDMGSKAPKDVKVTGLWYAQFSPK